MCCPAIPYAAAAACAHILRIGCRCLVSWRSRSKRASLRTRQLLHADMSRQVGMDGVQGAGGPEGGRDSSEVCDVLAAAVG